MTRKGAHMDEFDELAGRIEGLSRALLHTVAALEDAALIDGLRLADGWRQSVRAAGGPPALVTAELTLQELAQALDDARSRRRSRAHPD